SAQHVLFRTGDQIPSGQTFYTFAATEKYSFAFNARGDYMMVGNFNTGGFPDRRVVLNGMSVLREGQAIPGGTYAAYNLLAVAVDINDLGDYVIQTNATVGTAIIKGTSFDPASQAKFIQTGDPGPDPAIANFVMTKVGTPVQYGLYAKFFAPAIITNSGDVIWYGEWDAPDPS